MKKYLLFSAAFFFCSLVTFGQTKKEAKKTELKTKESKFVGDPNKPITFKQMLIEDNDMQYGSENLFSFEFTNTGVDTLTITALRTSCGCTKAIKPEHPIAPGETATISVSYDTKRVGAFAKDVFVVTDKTEPITLTIKGIVNPQKIDLEEESEVEGN